MSHRIVLGALSSLEHALGTSPLVVVSTTRQFLERSMGRREGGSGTAGMACSELSEMDGGEGRQLFWSRHLLYSHLILICLCRMYYTVSITVEFLLFRLLSLDQHLELAAPLDELDLRLDSSMFL